MSTLTYGFIGLGNMGSPMATRLLNAGHTLGIYDTNPATIEKLKALGATVFTSTRTLADAATTIFLSLPTPQIVEDVALGESGLIHGTAVKQVVDLSTIGPRTAQKVSEALAKKSILYVDSPVSGGIGGAVKGTLAIMTACPKDVYETLQPVLACFGPTFYLGEKAGLGQSMKLANNLLSACAMAITSEAMVMGVKAGLDPAIMIDVINAGSGRNSATQDKFPKAVLTRTFDIGFAAQLAYKDVRLAVDESEAIGVPMVVGAAVREMLVMTTAQFGSAADFTDIARVVESWAGVEIRPHST